MGGVPSAVRKQAEKAEQIQRQLAGKKGSDEDVIVENPPNNQQVQDPPRQSQADNTGQGDDWEKRFKGLQKSHERTVAELRDSNESLIQQNQDLAGQIRELRAEIQTAKPDAPAAQEITFTPEEQEEYGEAFLSMVKKVADQLVKSQDSSAVMGELRGLRDDFDEIKTRQIKSDEDRFFDEVAASVPDWEEINETPDFKDWLAQEMPLTGQERQVFLNQARKRFDAKTVINLFNAWKGEAGIQPFYPSSVTTREDEVDISNTSGDNYVFTGAEIQKFYDEKRRGRWKGREEEARRFEERIFLAQKEGRVR